MLRTSRTWKRSARARLQRSDRTGISLSTITPAPSSPALSRSDLHPPHHPLHVASRGILVIQEHDPDPDLGNVTGNRTGYPLHSRVPSLLGSYSSTRTGIPEGNHVPAEEPESHRGTPGKPKVPRGSGCRRRELWRLPGTRAWTHPLNPLGILWITQGVGRERRKGAAEATWTAWEACGKAEGDVNGQRGGPDEDFDSVSPREGLGCETGHGLDFLQSPPRVGCLYLSDLHSGGPGVVRGANRYLTARRTRVNRSEGAVEGPPFPGVPNRPRPCSGRPATRKRASASESSGEGGN